MQPRQQSLYLLRHGKIEQAGVLAGHTDFPLSAEGYQQMLQQLEKLPSINQVICSPLTRCRAVATEFSKQQKIPLQLEPAIKEMHFGDWDGQSFEELWQNTKTLKGCGIGDFWQNPWQTPPPNGETMAAFTARVNNWWQQWLTLTPKLEMPSANSAIDNSPSANSSINTLVISHAGVIKHLLALIIGLDIKQNQQLNVFDIPYAGLIRIDVYFDENNKAWPKIVF
ncbi:MAG: histidine phosphatase family protein [Thalassotalea sp.]